MGNYIVIDGGTTNTRVGLVRNGETEKIIKLSIGAGSKQSHQQYISSIRDAILEINKPDCDIECILAAGMITSDLGLYKLDHIKAPAGVKELKDSIKKVSLPEISDIPFCFIPGVKTTGTLDGTDMMRGEECEVYGLTDRALPDSVYVLPGSHSKIIQLDDAGRIINLCTMLTGEMAAALSQGTILRDAVSFSAGDADSEYLLRGYRYCKKHGINEALFKVRILKNLLNRTEKEVYSFFLGVVLEGEIEKILSTSAKTVFVAGKKQLREATAYILREVSNKKIVTADQKTVELSTFKGMIKIYESK